MHTPLLLLHNLPRSRPVVHRHGGKLGERPPGRAGLVRKFHRLQLLDGTVVRRRDISLPICDWLASDVDVSWRRRLTLIVL
jgi:hypothetical protein